MGGGIAFGSEDLPPHEYPPSHGADPLIEVESREAVSGGVDGIDIVIHDDDRVFAAMEACSEANDGSGADNNVDIEMILEELATHHYGNFQKKIAAVNADMTSSLMDVHRSGGDKDM